MTLNLPLRAPLVVRIIAASLLPLCCIILSSKAAHGQQPFVTDDADVTDRGKFHFEFSNQFDFLQRDAFPGLKQNTASFELAYGLLPRVEISFEVPLVSFLQCARGGRASDRLRHRRRECLRQVQLPARTRRFAPPRPDFERRGRDSDRQRAARAWQRRRGRFVERHLAEILHATHQVPPKGGIVFSGNTLNGAVAVKTRGTVYTGGASVVREFTPKLQLGAELNGARARNPGLGKRQLQAQFG